MAGESIIFERESLAVPGRRRAHLLWRPPHPTRALLLFLHGKGERGEDPHRAALHGPLREVAEGRSPATWILAPSCPVLEADPADRAWTRWDDVLPDVLDVLDAVIATRDLDPGAVSLAGISMGGRGTFLLGARHPERFRRLLAFCGWGEPEWAPALARTPLLAYHGLDDEVVPPTSAIALLAAVQRRQPSARLRLLPDTGHDCWTAAFRSEEVWRFLDTYRPPPP